MSTLHQAVHDKLEELSAHDLPQLADLCRTAELVRDAVDDTVAVLREQGVTWRVLAEVTGLTQQGLMLRQRRLLLDRSEEAPAPSTEE